MPDLAGLRAKLVLAREPRRLILPLPRKYCVR
jgi:hypothetical protein